MLLSACLSNWILNIQYFVCNGPKYATHKMAKASIKYNGNVHKHKQKQSKALIIKWMNEEKHNKWFISSDWIRHVLSKHVPWNMIFTIQIDTLTNTGMYWSKLIQESKNRKNAKKLMNELVGNSKADSWKWEI